ncbi:MAG: fumarate hydratase C-terminal domain-containing protein [Clostridia bacterium]|nr:fumarate hydratase C-terminal domain-containing protein [Clostridia bacterium]
MKIYHLDTADIRKYTPLFNSGDKVYLSGTVYTARDAAHKRIFELIDNKGTLPFEIKNSVIYYAGPTPTPDNLPIGSCGPTTSCRMDSFAPKLYDMGMCATIGKGERSEEVINSIIRNDGVYLCAIGGAGALAALSIEECEVIAFEDLGCESVKKLKFKEFPLIVGIDSNGGNIFR